MTRKCKYAFAALSFLGSAATSIYFGVSSFFPAEAPFQNTAYQKQHPGHEFIRGGVDDPEWSKKLDVFSKEIKDENDIKRIFKDGHIEKYSNFISNYKKGSDGSEGKIKEFLHKWCYENRASENGEIFNLIRSYCTKGNESKPRA